MTQSYFRIPFALSGDKSSIPLTDPGSGVVNMTDGYGDFYGLNPVTDPAALRIERDKMNQLFYLLCLNIQHLQQNGAPEFIESADNGGSPYSYADNALVRRAGVLYLSRTNANTTAPPGANWVVLDLDLYAPLASPALTGTPTAPTPATIYDNSSSIANTTWVQNLINFFGLGSQAFNAVTNLNSIIDGSMFRYAAGATNAPDGNPGTVLTMAIDGNNKTQIAITGGFLGVPKAFIRQQFVGGWNGWSTLLGSSTTGDFVTQVGQNSAGYFRIWNTGYKEMWVPAASISPPYSDVLLPTVLSTGVGANIFASPLSTSAVLPGYGCQFTTVASIRIHCTNAFTAAVYVTGF